MTRPLRRMWALPWLVAALAVRLLFAPGMMPGAGAHGPTIEVCPGMTMGHAPKHAGHDRGAPITPCPYEALGAPALAVDAGPPPFPARLLLSWVSEAERATAATPTRHAPAPPARAPPDRAPSDLAPNPA